MICRDLSPGGAPGPPGSPGSPRSRAATVDLLRGLFEQVDVAIVVFRVGSTGTKAVRANAAAAALLGCDASDLLGHGWRSRLGPCAGPRLDQDLRGTLDAGTRRTVHVPLPGAGSARATLTAVPSLDAVVAQLTAAAPPTGDVPAPRTAGPRVALDEVVRRVAGRLRRADGHRDVELEVRVLGRGLATSGDPGALERALAELLGHALRGTPPGGRVVTTLVREHRQVVVAVEDGCAGPDGSAFGCVWSGARPGSGMALVRAVVGAHGGTVDVCSGIGLGTRTVVRLPALPALPAP